MRPSATQNSQVSSSIFSPPILEVTSDCSGNLHAITSLRRVIVSEIIKIIISKFEGLIFLNEAYENTRVEVVMSMNFMLVVCVCQK